MPTDADRLRQRTASPDLAAQETFLVVWRDAGRFRGRGEVGAWSAPVASWWQRSNPEIGGQLFLRQLRAALPEGGRPLAS